MSGIPLQFDPLGNSLLPAGYKRVNYLESTGTQWIDTGIVPDVLTKWEVELIATKKAEVGSNFDTYGVRNNDAGSQKVVIQIYNVPDGAKVAYGYGNNNYWGVNTLSRHLYCIDAKNLCIKTDNDNIVLIQGDISSVYDTLTIFALHVRTNGALKVINYTCSKCFLNKIWKNDVLIQYLIPSLDRQNRPCMFDLVTRTPFYNQGTGEFLWG